MMNNQDRNSASFQSLAPTAEMQALLEHSDRSIIILDNQFRILWFNAKASQGMYAFYGDELKTGYTYWDYVDEDCNKRFIRNFSATLKGRTISTEQRIAKPGVEDSELWVEGRFSPLTDKNGSITGVIYSYINISGRKQTERNSIERENVLQAIDHNDSQGFILINEKDKILSCNLLAPVLLYTITDEEDPYGSDIVKCIHPDWKERFEGGLKVARAGGTVAIEFEKPEPNDSIVEIRFTPVKDRLGKQNMVSIWVLDITDKKHAEQEVKRSEENLRTVFDNSSQTFYLVDRNLNILAFNKTAQQMVLDMYEQELKVGMNVSEITPMENLVQFKVETERAFSGRKVVVEKYFKIKGEERWYERHINPVINENGVIDRITMWSLDITDRKIAEKALKENESRFRKLAALLPVGIYQVDEYGNTTYINESLQTIIGSDMRSILDGSWTRHIHEDDIQGVKSLWETIEKNKQTFSHEYRYNKKNNTTAFVLEQAQPLFNHLGEYRGYLGTVIDISEQKRNQQLIQEKLVAENSLKFRSDFLASMSHEIRTPLNGIMGMSEVLLDSRLDEDQKSKINNILKASIDLRSIINEVLDLSKLEAGKVSLQKEHFKLSQLLELTRERYQPEAELKGLAFKIENTVGSIEPYSDRRRIMQVLSNLVRNAIKFTATGKVIIRVSDGKNETIKFEVIDTGLGIPLKEQKKLFQDFSQLDHTTAQDLEGTGLGLSISKKLTQLLGGEIGVTSKPNRGSIFWFTINSKSKIVKSNSDKKEQKKLEKKKTVNTKQLHVLLVEDNLINQQAFRIMLKKMGYAVDVQSNGKQALDNFGKCKYDIVFMDIQMPEMDGLQATSEIKKLYQNVPPIIGLSGNILQRDEEGNLKSDMDDLLLKPVVSRDLQRMIDKWVA